MRPQLFLIRSLIPALSIVFLCAIALTLISRTMLRSPLFQASHELSISIEMLPDPTLDIPASSSGREQTIVLAGGCQN
jgi:hypothetical protein